MSTSRSSNLYWPLATFVNMAAVIAGSLAGLFFQQTFDEGLKAIVFQAVGLGTLVLGMQMALRMPNGYLLVFFFSLILGGITGQLLDLQSWMMGLSDTLKAGLGVGDEGFTEGLITAFLLFCAGSVTIIGALEEGLHGRRELLLVKSLLDGFTAIALTATFGIGVAFSVLPMLILQGGLTLLASKLRPLMTMRRTRLLSAVGGALIIGIGIELLGLGDPNLENLLPALVLLFPLSFLAEYSGLVGLITGATANAADVPRTDNGDNAGDRSTAS